MIRLVLTVLGLAMLAAVPASAEGAVRGLIPRAREPVVMDGKLDEWLGSFATPVNFGHPDWPDRAAVWRYLWDDQALYIGLECLDNTLFNADPGPIYNGDGVEFYLDVREPGMLGGKDFAAGTVHLFFTAASNKEIKPRIQIRPNLPAFANFTTEGMEAASVRTGQGYTLEFKLPWSKFPEFRPVPGREIGIDCELCSSDGGPRVDRCWVYSGAAAVGSPSAFGRVRLVNTWDPADASAYSPVLFPAFVARSSPLLEPASLIVAVSPALQPLVRRVEITAGERQMPFTSLKKLGPGWLRAQCCLVGFTQATDEKVTARFFGEGDRLLGASTVSLK